MGKEVEEQDTETVIVEEEETEIVDESGDDDLEEDTDTEADDSEPGSDDSEDDESDEVVVTIGDSPTPDESKQEAPAWVKELRKTNRETQRENRELKKKLDALNNPTKPEVKLGPKPKIEDYDYDTTKFEADLVKWYETKKEVDKQEDELKAQQAHQQKAWQKQLDAYDEKKSKLKVRNFDDAEANVLEAFDETQQGIVISGADDPALTFYALGTDQKKLKELAEIKDPVKFSFAVAKLETTLKVKKRKAPPPERTVNGTAPKSGSVDSELERLRAEAEKTGNYSKVHQYKQRKRKAKN